MLAQIGLATELLWQYGHTKISGSPDTTGTAGLRHPALTPRRIRGLRKWRLGVGQHLEAGLWERCLVLLRPRSCPWPVGADPQFAPRLFSFPSAREDATVPESGEDDDGGSFPSAEEIVAALALRDAVCASGDGRRGSRGS